MDNPNFDRHSTEHAVGMLVVTLLFMRNFQRLWICFFSHPPLHSRVESQPHNRQFQLPATVLLLLLTASTQADPGTTEAAANLPDRMRCQAIQTAGLHDYAGAPESYEASTFFESKFELRINKVLTRHLATRAAGVAEATPDLFLTLRPSPASLSSADSSAAAGERASNRIELRCRQIQGQSKELGYSCTNTPPSELLLINPANLRFTRAAIGGWTFSDRVADSNSAATSAKDAQPGTTATEATGAHLGNDSLFVEFGNCERR